MNKLIKYIIQNQKLYNCINGQKYIILVPNLDLDMKYLKLESLININIDNFVSFRIYSNKIEIVSVYDNPKSGHKIDIVLITLFEYEKILLGLEFEYTNR